MSNHGGTVGIGIDAVDIERFRQVLTRSPRIADRLFTDSERDYASKFEDPVPRLAARFAVKEAVLKALGVGIGAFRFADLEITNDESGAPSLALSGGAQQLSTSRGIRSWLVSLTHTELIASAVVLAQ
jgi:holo-[acyl-carrier protein] synthase